MIYKREEFDLVVFDWDGTLMDSVGNIARALQAAFSEHGLPEPDYYAARHVIGLGMNDIFASLAPGLSAVRIDDIIEKYKKHYAKALTMPVLYEGVSQWLLSFQQAGYQLAVATGKSRTGLNEVLQETALHSFFSITRTADETYSKPHPQMLNEILAVTGVDKQRTIVIGDTIYDLQMAANAGCAGVAMSYGAHDVKTLQTAGPLHIFDDFHTLGSWLVPMQQEK